MARCISDAFCDARVPISVAGFRKLAAAEAAAQVHAQDAISKHDYNHVRDIVNKVLHDEFCLERDILQICLL